VFDRKVKKESAAAAAALVTESDVIIASSPHWLFVRSLMRAFNDHLSLFFSLSVKVSLRRALARSCFLSFLSVFVLFLCLPISFRRTEICFFSPSSLCGGLKKAKICKNVRARK